jgi:hypothetical protein
MKIIRIKYVPPLGPLLQDLQRIFPLLPITAQYLDDVGGILIDAPKKRFVYVKEKRNPDTGVRTKVIVYALVRDSFVVPNWIQGVQLADMDATDPIDHYFLGYEVRVLDREGEAPDNEVL